MLSHSLLKAQQTILKLVVARYPQVYLVGGTAMSLRYRHRASEDLDFFTQAYTRALHRRIASSIRRHTGFPCAMVSEEVRRQYVPMAVYDCTISRGV